MAQGTCAACCTCPNPQNWLRTGGSIYLKEVTFENREQRTDIHGYEEVPWRLALHERSVWRRDTVRSTVPFFPLSYPDLIKKKSSLIPPPLFSEERDDDIVERRRRHRWREELRQLERQGFCEMFQDLRVCDGIAVFRLLCVSCFGKKLPTGDGLRSCCFESKELLWHCSVCGLFYDASRSVYLVPNATCILENICAWHISVPLPDNTTFAPSGVCAGNWTRKEKRSMGLLMPHRTLVCASPSRSPLAYYQFQQKRKQFPGFDFYE